MFQHSTSIASVSYLLLHLYSCMFSSQKTHCTPSSCGTLLSLARESKSKITLWSFFLFFTSVTHIPFKGVFKLHYALCELGLGLPRDHYGAAIAARSQRAARSKVKLVTVISHRYLDMTVQRRLCCTLRLSDAQTDPCQPCFVFFLLPFSCSLMSLVWLLCEMCEKKSVFYRPHWCFCNCWWIKPGLIKFLFLINSPLSADREPLFCECWCFANSEDPRRSVYIVIPFLQDIVWLM